MDKLTFTCYPFSRARHEGGEDKLNQLPGTHNLTGVQVQLEEKRYKDGDQRKGDQPRQERGCQEDGTGGNRLAEWRELAPAGGGPEGPPREEACCAADKQVIGRW